MSAQSKPSIVFCHGLWADGSCFSKLIPSLQADGHQVIAAQYGLDTPEGDVETVIRTLGRVNSPAILVGHSYGGSVITAAGTDDRVVGLVYIAALAPDADETSQTPAGQVPHAPTSSRTSRSPTDASGCSQTASTASRATYPRPRSSSYGRPRPYPTPACSAATPRAWRGGPSPAGTSAPPRTTRCTRSWRPSSPSVWAPRRTTSTQATSRCSPIPTSCSTSSALPPARSKAPRPPPPCRRRTGRRWAMT